jgi:hypothetical protein
MDEPKAINSQRGGGGHSHSSGAAMLHILDAGLCTDFETISAGDELVAISAYNIAKYSL